MTNEILLNGISLEQLESSIKTIVFNEIHNAVLSLTTTLQTDTTPELLTRKATAELLGVSLPTLHAWTRKGVLPAQTIGTRVRYRKTDILNALKDVKPLKYRRA
jgi:excisionase family DNA binding protein